MIWQEQVLRSLHTTGMRITSPRRRILAWIAASTVPFTAESVAVALPEVGRATVYRTLDVLASSHWLARLHCEDGEHAYTPAYPHQHQLACIRCGRTVAFERCNLDGVLRALGQETGFHITGHALEAFGICRQCQTAPAAL